MDMVNNSTSNATQPDRDVGTPIIFMLDTWRKPIDGFFHVSDNGIKVIAYIERVGRWDQMHFYPYTGSGTKQLLRTWLCLALGKAIPITRHNIEWVAWGSDKPCLRIVPAWPADFSLLAWFSSQHDIEPTVVAIEHMWTNVKT